ncbi:MAG TPA: response regulator transcription factor [Actinomycetota bacterium]|nr:response regulator transcription factor [Actinomycetota bacterium]
MSALPAPGLDRPRVLLVEDDQALREALRDFLEDFDVDVVGEAVDGREGVRMALDVDPDVVLMDLRMPVLGGIEAAGQIHERRPDVPVIILTAYDDPALKGGAERSGVYAYLVKGCPPREITNATFEAWNERRSRRGPGKAVRRITGERPDR